MDIKILIATHKESNIPNLDCYLPVQVGAEINGNITNYQKDNTLYNISELNPYFSELTALYWGWKNLSCDYLGLVHYRRYFGKENVKYREDVDLNNLVISSYDIKGYLDNKTVLVPKKRNYYIESLYSHYANTFDGKHLDITKSVIKKLTPEYIDSFDKVMRQKKGHMFNMYIAPKHISDNYCEWLFPILFELQNNIDTSNMTAFEARLFGRISELLFNVWIEKNGIITQELPLLDAFKVNWLKKGGAFLMAKFFKKKYKKSF
ncbi:MULTISPECIES: DUF4422 domain-containing protein [unclassified Gemella]|uniref:DUF4422 domain-containing protein n=1 Tax=unclassified Gemella TaxID=2624949 RepID=UPI001C54F4D1|nr:MULTISPECIES: DUF4422 domain-containing protein [unclassified Gemella]